MTIYFDEDPYTGEQSMAAQFMNSLVDEDDDE